MTSSIPKVFAFFQANPPFPSLYPQDYSEMQYRRRHRRRSRGDMLSLHNLRSSSNTPESSRRSDNTGGATRRTVLCVNAVDFVPVKAVITFFPPVINISSHLQSSTSWTCSYNMSTIKSLHFLKRSEQFVTFLSHRIMFNQALQQTPTNSLTFFA